MRKILFTVLILSVICFAFAKAKRTVLKANPNSNVILVAVMQDTDTEFKNSLIASLKSNYEPRYQVKKVLIKKAKELNNAQYRLLIVMDQNKAWLAMNGQTKAIMKLTDYDNAIFFMTSGDKKWQWKEKDVHHIASASEKSFFPKAWAELKTKVDELLK